MLLVGGVTHLLCPRRTAIKMALPLKRMRSTWIELVCSVPETGVITCLSPIPRLWYSCLLPLIFSGSHSYLRESLPSVACASRHSGSLQPLCREWRGGDPHGCTTGRVLVLADLARGDSGSRVCSTMGHTYAPPPPPRLTPTEGAKKPRQKLIRLGVGTNKADGWVMAVVSVIQCPHVWTDVYSSFWTKVTAAIR